MPNSVFQSQLEDKEALEGLLNTEMPPLESVGFEGKAGAAMGLEEAVERVRSGKTDLRDPRPEEAIVMLRGFPSLLIRNGTYANPDNPVWRDRLDPFRAPINHVIANTGRVDLVGHPDNKWVGTAWRVNETSFITNRHVAEIFAKATRRGHGIQSGVKVFIDLAEEHDSDEVLEHLISSITHIEEKSAGGIDMAVLKLSPSGADIAGDPIDLALDSRMPDFIGVTGYPARDWRNPEDAMNRYFGGVFNKKRFAPGNIMNANHAAQVFTHNCTTLGGNSGSVVCDIETGCAIGLHFAGSAQDQNYAVKATALADVLRSRSVGFSECRAAAGGDAGEERRRRRSADDFADRDGYDPAFLGTGSLLVPVPQLNICQKPRLAQLSTGEELLNYRHFSVALNKDRRLAFYCAANIDGDDLRRPRRKNSFHLDPRVAEEHQAGEDLYSRNDFDRGHLIRRLDPTWGTKEDAEQANVDSMFFPNIAPQHKRLNQKIWLDLEDHILDRTDARDARISVFVGCIFGENDPPQQRTGIRVPMAFWKIAASVGRETRGRSNRRVLQTQAFVMSQADFVKPGDLEIIFGDGFETFQITVEELERLTGLDFHVMRDADTFGLPPEMRRERIADAATAETPFMSTGDVMKPLGSVDDIVL